MKKVLITSLLLVACAGSAFGATQLNTNTVSGEGVALYGGTDQTSAEAAVHPLVRFSTGVTGLVNYTVTAGTNNSPGYAICTKHTNGSKVFGTANDSTNIYWKASPAKTVMTNSETGSTATNANFGAGWTSY